MILKTLLTIFCGIVFCTTQSFSLKHSPQDERGNTMSISATINGAKHTYRFQNGPNIIKFTPGDYIRCVCEKYGYNNEMPIVITWIHEKDKQLVFSAGPVEMRSFDITMKLSKVHHNSTLACQVYNESWSKSIYLNITLLSDDIGRLEFAAIFNGKDVTNFIEQSPPKDIPPQEATCDIGIGTGSILLIISIIMSVLMTSLIYLHMRRQLSIAAKPAESNSMAEIVEPLYTKVIGYMAPRKNNPERTNDNFYDEVKMI